MRRKYPFAISEIAQAAGVSSATVSRVLNSPDAVTGDLHDRVCQAIRDKGHDPGQFILQSSNTGKLILFTLPFDFNSFFNEIVKGAKASAIQHGYQLLILQEHINANTFPSFEKTIRSLKISGIIALNHIREDLLRPLAQMVPIVQCCDYDLASRTVSSVSFDDRKMARAAIDYLVSLERRRIAFMSGPLKYRDNLFRKEGYLDSLQANNIEPVPNWMVQLPEMNYSMAFSTATQILSQPVRPDAFLAISDLFACAIVNAARRLGLSVPEDLMIIGYDNTDYSLISTPTLTTVNTPKFQLGYTTCELLVERIQNPDAAIQHIGLPSELIIRESTTLR